MKTKNRASTIRVRIKSYCADSGSDFDRSHATSIDCVDDVGGMRKALTQLQMIAETLGAERSYEYFRNATAAHDLIDPAQLCRCAAKHNCISNVQVFCAIVQLCNDLFVQ